MADFGRRVWRRSRHARGEGWKRVRACGHTYIWCADCAGWVRGLFAIRRMSASLLLRKQYLSLRELFQSLWDKHCSRSERGVGVRAASN